MFSRIVWPRGVRVALVVFGVVYAAGCLWAQEQAAATSIDAGSVSVKADALAPSNAAPASDIVVIDADQIKATKARDLADLLNQVAGVNINSYGNAGGTQSVSIRGSTFAQVIVIVDGQRLYDPQFGGSDLSLLGADNIEKIEILRGGASAAYGADAVGGVIRITSKKIKKDGLSLTVENRSYVPQVYQGDVSNENRSGNALALVSGQHAAVDGSYGIGEARLSLLGVFDRDMGLYTYQDSTGATRLRNQVATWGGNGQIGLTAPLGGGQAAVMVDAQARRSGVPGDILYSLTPDAFEDNDNARLTLGWKTDSLGSDLFNFDSQLWGQWSKLYDQYTGGSTDSTLKSFGGDIGQTAFLSDNVTLGYGLTGRYESLSDINENLTSRTSGGAYLNSTLKFGNFSILPAIRVDVFSDVPAGIGLHLGAELALSKESKLWISAGRSYRAPTFNDLYYPKYVDPTYGTYQGNPNLKPESSWSGELGFARTNQQLSWRTSAFARYVLDEIANDTIGSGSSSVHLPGNIDKSFYAGLDQDISIKIDWLRIGLNYEYNLSYFLGDGKGFSDNLRIYNVPEHSLGLRIGMRQDHVEFTVSEEFKSLRYYDDFSGSPYNNTNSLPAYFVLNAQVSWWFTDDSSIWLAADNLMNTQYQLIAGYPMPGLGLRLGLKVSI